MRICLAYPNTYRVAMSSLGFQKVYRCLNDWDHVVCERAFWPGVGPHPRPLQSLESGRRLSEFDAIAFSVSFENDYTNILQILTLAGIPLLARQRREMHPLILAGGVATFLNPEPLAAFMDLFLIGEAEALLPGFVSMFDAGAERSKFLLSVARGLPGAYVPSLYRPVYDSGHHFTALQPLADVPERIRRQIVPDLAGVSTCSTVLTPATTFENTFLIEVARGCTRGCRFCSAGFAYRPPRFRPLPELQRDIQAGTALTRHIGLVAAAVTDVDGLEDLCRRAAEQNGRVSFSSLRADAVTPALAATLARSGVKTATIAPDAGSLRMRNVINKNLTEDHILNAAAMLVAEGVANLKLYFMVGLPTETEADIDAIVHLCKRIKHRFLQSSRLRKAIGAITVSLSAFVPKPWTPFQWAAMTEISHLKQKIRRVKQGLKQVANVRVHSDVPRWSYVQALLARGDRQVGRLLAAAHANSGNWAQTFKSAPLNADYFVYRTRPHEEIFPWDFIDHGIHKTFLLQEYRRALAAQPSPPCPVKNCHRCGACSPADDDD